MDDSWEELRAPIRAAAADYLFGAHAMPPAGHETMPLANAIRRSIGEGLDWQGSWGAIVLWVVDRAFRDVVREWPREKDRSYMVALTHLLVRGDYDERSVGTVVSRELSKDAFRKQSKWPKGESIDSFLRSSVTARKGYAALASGIATTRSMFEKRERGHADEVIDALTDGIVRVLTSEAELAELRDTFPSRPVPGDPSYSVTRRAVAADAGPNEAMPAEAESANEPDPANPSESPAGEPVATPARGRRPAHARGMAAAALLVTIAAAVTSADRGPDLVAPPPGSVASDRVATAGWGPSRPMIEEAQRSEVITMNSVSNNPAHGHEANFAQARPADGPETEYADELAVEPGIEYEAFAYFRNGASEEFPASAAEGVRLRTELPAVVRGSGVVNLFLESPNATPNVVWDGFVLVLSDPSHEAAVRYVPGSAEIHSGGSVDGEALDDGLSSEEGVLLGCDALDGRLPPGAPCSGFVTFRFVVDQADFEVSVTARKSATDAPSTSSVEVTAGDRLELLVEYTNAGTTRQNDVVVHINGMPTGLTYLNGSTRLTSRSLGGEPEAVGDGVASGGLNIGDFEPGANAFVTFEAVATGPGPDNPTGSAWVTADPFVRVMTNNGYKEASLSLLFLGDPPGSPGRSDEDAEFWEAHSGPRREMFYVASGGSPYPSFNSILDNPHVGDERNFVGLRPVTREGIPNVWSDDVWGEAGDEFVARIFVHNAGVAGEDPAGVNALQQARVRAGLSSGVDEVSFFGELSAVNAMTVWDGATIHLTEGLKVVVDEASVKLENNAHGPDGLELGGDILGERGTSLGYQEMDGIVPPGYQYDAYVTLVLRVQDAGA